ncbi:hypothetical protein SprV_0100148900 [Sparganum proliferum]
MILISARNLNGVKVEDVSHLRNMGCYLRLWVPPSHSQLMLMHSRLQSSAGFPNVVARPTAALKSADHGRHLLLRDRVFWPHHLPVDCRVRPVGNAYSERCEGSSHGSGDPFCERNALPRLWLILLFTPLPFLPSAPFNECSRIAVGSEEFLDGFHLAQFGGRRSAMSFQPSA